MSTIDAAIKNIRPSLRLVAPQTFWFSLGFGIFNITVGVAILASNIFSTLHLAGIVPLKVWAAIFIAHGIAMLWMLAINDWRATRFLNVIGVIIKTSWWLGLLVLIISGIGVFLFYAWSLILFLQIVNCLYFMPRMIRD